MLSTFNRLPIAEPWQNRELPRPSSSTSSVSKWPDGDADLDHPGSSWTFDRCHFCCGTLALQKKKMLAVLFLIFLGLGCINVHIATAKDRKSAGPSALWTISRFGKLRNLVKEYGLGQNRQFSQWPFPNIYRLQVLHSSLELFSHPGTKQGSALHFVNSVKCRVLWWKRTQQKTDGMVVSISRKLVFATCLPSFS